MPITVHSATNQIYNGASVTTITFPYTMVNSTSGAGRALVVALAGFTTSSRTYNGVAMARLRAVTSPDAELFYLGDADLPTDGLSHDIALNYGTARTDADILILEVSGCTQPLPGALNQNIARSSAADPHSVTLTTVANAADVFLFYFRGENRTMVSQPSGTHHYSTDTGTLNDAKRITQVVGPTPAASTTWTWDPSSSSNFRAFALELTASGSTSKPYYYSHLLAA